MIDRRTFLRAATGAVGVGAFAPEAVRAGMLPFAPEPPPENFSSDRNYVMTSGGAYIRGLRVTVHVTVDIVAPTGLNMQLNAYSAEGSGCVYQQFCIAIDPNHENRLGWSNENFPSKAFRWDLHNSVGLSCGGHDTESTCSGDFLNHKAVLGFFPSLSNRIPAGSRVTWHLLNDEAGKIAGATYGFVDPSGRTATSGRQLITSFDYDKLSINVQPKALAPIVGFELNIVALNGGRHATFQGGAGWIEYSAETRLGPQPRPPDNAAARNTVTKETSNVTYSIFAAAPKTRVVQQFGTPYRVNEHSGYGPCSPPSTLDPATGNCINTQHKAYDQAPTGSVSH